MIVATVAVASATPLLLTPLLEQKKLAEARNLSKITVGKGVHMGNSGFFTVPTETGKIAFTS